MNNKITQDQTHCTNSGFNSLEKKSKPLFFKELKKVWQKVKKGGPYSASNTLLIDDKPYKALLNPVILNTVVFVIITFENVNIKKIYILQPNTAIFPEPYNPKDKNDAALGEKLYFSTEFSCSNDFRFTYHFV